jgi:hypothetical protein
MGRRAVSTAKSSEKGKMKFIQQVFQSAGFVDLASRTTRALRGLAPFALFVAAALTLAGPPRQDRAHPESRTPLRGEAAVRRLKADGGYDSLSAAMAAARYQIFTAAARPGRTAGSDQSGRPAPAYYANNSKQRLRVTFTPEEIRVAAAPGGADRKKRGGRPADPAGGEVDGPELRVRLAGYGRGDRLEAPAGGDLIAQGARVEIRKSTPQNRRSAITEWYENTPEGLEQGFTVAAPPAGDPAGGRLRVALGVGEGWKVCVRGDQQGAVFERQVDGLRLDYDHLLAFDAAGRALPARMAPGSAFDGSALSLLVDDARAAYPITIDPILSQQRKLTASDGVADDRFGTSVAVSGDTAVIGAPRDDVTGKDQGSVYVFTRSFSSGGAAWTQQQRFTALDVATGEEFGSAVAISGDSIVVGAPGDTRNGKGSIGSAYVFVRNGAVWTQQEKLLTLDGEAEDFFGFAVAISRDTVVVGAPNDDVGANADQGSAYVFVRGNGSWTQQQKIVAADGAAGDFFSLSVAVSGDTVAVGAFGDDVGANANQGSAYIFTRNGKTWSQQRKLTAADGAANDLFGFSIALSGDTVAVGATSATIGANARQGAAYVFTRGPSPGGGAQPAWAQQQKLVANDGAAEDGFGRSIAIAADAVVVGAPGDDVDGIQNRGSAYLFARGFTAGGAAQPVWTQQQKLSGSDGVADDQVGMSVAVGGDTVVAGAPFADVGAGRDQGAAYVFVIRANNYGQQQAITAGDGASGDFFGRSVSFNGDTVAVGADGDDIGSAIERGSAYVFVRSGTTWSLQQKLTADDGATGDEFGRSVSLSGDTLAVGAPFHAVGANASQGAVYIFVRTGSVWAQQQKLSANDGAAFVSFGFSVALSRDTVAVGTPLDTVGPNQFQGSAYVFIRKGAVWTQQQKLTANDGKFSSEFGRSIAISGETVLVGAPGDKIGANVDQGSAYVFTRGGAEWTLRQKLTAGDGAEFSDFGGSVAVSDRTLVAGAPGSAVGSNENQGAAYVFARAAAGWTLQQKLTANDGAADDAFGASVSVSGDILAAGAPGDDVGSNKDQGSAYIFTRSFTPGGGGQPVWTRQQKFSAGDGAPEDGFGCSVSVSGDTVAVGALTKDKGASGSQGAAYAFVSPACPTVTLNPGGLPGARVGVSYTQTVTASGGGGPFQFSLSDGALPPGLSLSQNGQLSGSPTAAGVYRFTVTATVTSSLCPGSRSYTLTVSGGTCPAITLNPPVLPAAQMGATYGQQLSGSGGTEPYSFALTAGSLPGNMALSPAGALTGAPTASGTFNFAAQATDASGCAGTRNYMLSVAGCPSITISPGSLPDGTTGAEYGQSLTATGGVAPYSFTLSAGALPTGLSLAANGALGGTPVAAGSFNFSARATDAGGCQGSRSYTLTVKTGSCAFLLSQNDFVLPPAGGRRTDAPGRQGAMTGGSPSIRASRARGPAPSRSRSPRPRRAPLGSARSGSPGGKCLSRKLPRSGASPRPVSPEARWPGNPSWPRSAPR